MPSIVVLVILAVAIIGPSVGWWQSHLRLEKTTADFQSFKDNIQLEGERSARDREKKETALAKAAVNIQGELNETRLARDKRFSDFERMLAAAKATRAGGGKAVDPATSAPWLACPDAGAEFNSRMAEFEGEVSQRILKTRDEAISRTIACKAYLEQIENITNQRGE